MNDLKENTDEGATLAETTVQDQEYYKAKDFVHNFVDKVMKKKDKRVLQLILNAGLKRKE